MNTPTTTSSIVGCIVRLDTNSADFTPGRSSISMQRGRTFPLRSGSNTNAVDLLLNRDCCNDRSRRCNVNRSASSDAILSWYLDGQWPCLQTASTDINHGSSHVSQLEVSNGSSRSSNTAALLVNNGVPVFQGVIHLPLLSTRSTNSSDISSYLRNCQSSIISSSTTSCQLSHDVVSDMPVRDGFTGVENAVSGSAVATTAAVEQLGSIPSTYKIDDICNEEIDSIVGVNSHTWSVGQQTATLSSIDGHRAPIADILLQLSGLENTENVDPLVSKHFRCISDGTDDDDVDNVERIISPPAADGRHNVSLTSLNRAVEAKQSMQPYYCPLPSAKYRPAPEGCEDHSTASVVEHIKSVPSFIPSPESAFYRPRHSLSSSESSLIFF